MTDRTDRIPSTPHTPDHTDHAALAREVFATSDSPCSLLPPIEAGIPAHEALARELLRSTTGRPGAFWQTVHEATLRQPRLFAAMGLTGPQDSPEALLRWWQLVTGPLAGMAHLPPEFQWPRSPVGRGAWALHVIARRRALLVRALCDALDCAPGDLPGRARQLTLASAVSSGHAQDLGWRHAFHPVAMGWVQAREALLELTHANGVEPGVGASLGLRASDLRAARRPDELREVFHATRSGRATLMWTGDQISGFIGEAWNRPVGYTLDEPGRAGPFGLVAFEPGRPSAGGHAPQPVRGLDWQRWAMRVCPLPKAPEDLYSMARALMTNVPGGGHLRAAELLALRQLAGLGVVTQALLGFEVPAAQRAGRALQSAFRFRPGDPHIWAPFGR